MNVKKTIAAISAATVAVSAMAATVSAEETTKTYTYRLVNSVPSKSTEEATFTVVINDVVKWNTTTTTTDPNVEITPAAANGGDTGVTPTKDDTKYTATTDTTLELTATIVASADLDNDNDGTADAYSITWKDKDGYAVPAYDWLTLPAYTTTAPGSTTEYKFKVVATAGGSETEYDGTYTALDYVLFDLDPYTTDTTYNTDGTVKSGKDYSAISSLTITRLKDGVTDGTPYVRDPDQGDLNYSTYFSDPTATTTKYTLHNELNDLTVGSTYSLRVQVTVKVTELTDSKDEITGNSNAYIPVVSRMLGVSARYTDGDAANLQEVMLTTAPGTISTSLNYEVPFETKNSDNTDIIAFLEGKSTNQGFVLDRDGSTDDQEVYNNVAAVINDAIENSDNVTFRFNTATSAIAWAPVAAWGDYASWVRYDNYQDAYDASWAHLVNNGWSSQTPGVIAIYDSWGIGTTKYTAFGQQLYDWYYNPEATGNTGYDWVGTNLFAGALVINEYKTMSLSDTDTFDWTETSLSFDWDSIEQNAMTNNDYAKYITTMKLATSDTWYWDSMDLIITQGDAEDASSDAAAEGDDEELNDTEEDIEVEDEEDFEEPEEDEEPEEPEVEEQPAATNPTTGNASVALAVIPVALAAAAIVAKKRG